MHPACSTSLPLLVLWFLLVMPLQPPYLAFSLPSESLCSYSTRSMITPMNSLNFLSVPFWYSFILSHIGYRRWNSCYKCFLYLFFFFLLNLWMEWVGDCKFSPSPTPSPLSQLFPAASRTLQAISKYWMIQWTTHLNSIMYQFLWLQPHWAYLRITWFLTLRKSLIWFLKIQWRHIEPNYPSIYLKWPL